MSRPSGTDDNPNQTQFHEYHSCHAYPINQQSVDQEMVPVDISKSSRNKQRKRTSDVWEKFKKYKDEHGNVKAKCSLCEKSYDGSSKKGTSHLTNHFNSCQKKRNGGGASGSGDKPAGNSVTDQQLNHLDRNHFNSCQNKRNEGGASGSGDKPAGNSVTDQQLNHLDRVKMLIKNHFGSPVPGDTDIINVYKEEKEKLRIYFKNLSCHFSLTITDVNYGEYAGFMVHFIDDDWKLKEKMIGFKCIERDQNMEVLKNVLSDLGIDNKISSMVTNSDERENGFSYQGSLLSNCKFCVGDFSDIDMTCPDFEDEMGEVLYDHIRKIFNYITETSSKIGTFQIAARSLGKEVTAEDIQEKVKYKFGSALVKIAMGLKEAFIELENMDPEFKSINLTKEQWDVLTKFDQFCHEETDFDKIYWAPWITKNMYFPWLCCIYKKSLVFLTCWNSLNCGEEYPQLVSDAKKCWDECSLILAAAAVLDPRFKMDIVKHWYKIIYGDECEPQLAIFRDIYLTGVYNEYAKVTNNIQSSTSGSKEKKSSISYRMVDISGNSSNDHDSDHSLNIELHLYLKEVNFPLIEDFDILEWWQYHSRYFPTLAKMARDFLSIQIIVPDEDEDESLSLEDEAYFDSDNVKEAFMCTRNWLRKYEYE